MWQYRHNTIDLIILRLVLFKYILEVSDFNLKFRSEGILNLKPPPNGPHPHPCLSRHHSRGE